MAVIFVHTDNIQKNQNRKDNALPVITVSEDGGESGLLGHEVDIIKDGEVICKVIYEPFKPLPPGPRVWIDTLDCTYEVRTQDKEIAPWVRKTS